MRILVMGATGFLGSTVVRQLSAEDRFDVACTTRRPTDGQLTCDISNPAALQSMLDEVKPEAVVNCAVAADFSDSSLTRLWAVNALAPSVVARWCSEQNAHFVHASATLVHGTVAHLIGSTTPLDPDTDYGITKLLADQMIDASGAAAVTIRFGGIYGGAGPSHLGLNNAIRNARAGEAPTLMGSGRALRNYLHAEDAAAIIMHCLDRRVTGVRYAGGPETLSIAKMLQTICDVFLPGQSPLVVEGSEAADQIVESSDDLPSGRPMVEALKAEIVS